MKITPKCSYCGHWSQKVTGKTIYPHREDLHELVFYQCEPCNAYVGTHKTTGLPLGTLANAELRETRTFTHKAFDPIWLNRYMNRNEAYKWLAENMNIEKNDCHIAMFTFEQCIQAQNIIENYYDSIS